MRQRWKESKYKRMCKAEVCSMFSERPFEMAVSLKSLWGKEGRINHSWFLSPISKSYSQRALLPS